MKAEYFVTGEEAEAVAKEVGTVLGKTTAKTLRLREEPSTESRQLSLLAEGETYIVQEEGCLLYTSFAIGDPDQSIYGFRGSDAACFTRLAGENVDMRIIRLTRNYRSTPQILKSALAVINQNAGDIRYLTCLLYTSAKSSSWEHGRHH